MIKIDVTAYAEPKKKRGRPKKAKTQTAEEREARLAKQRRQWRARIDAETAEEREARLARKREARRNLTLEQREARNAYQRAWRAKH